MGKGFRVLAAYGKEEQVHFETEKLILCTNAFTPRFFPRLEMKPGRGVVLLTEPLEKLPFRGTFHYDAGYFYFRDFGNRILFGGARNHFREQETTTEMQVPDNVLEKLQQDLEAIILPGTKCKIEMAWSGIMAFGAVKQPLLGQLQEGLYGGFRLGGMGVAIGSSIGEQLALMVLGKREAPPLHT
jgi:glycine/D-amino acid oxidase-like deaminating enzyme